MAKKQKAKKPLDRLPNAPLAEVVFELRWKLHGNAPFLSDPGILPLISAFTARIAKAGFPAFKDLARPEEVVGHGVTRRFYPAPEASFPIVQIGPGVFASNQSSEYSWPKFKTQTLRALIAFLASYPKLEGYGLEPMHLELRYIDVFDESLVGTLDIVEFVNRGTTFRITQPDILSNPTLFPGESEGRISIRKEVKKGTIFVMDLASGRHQVKGDKLLRLETKVVTTSLGKYQGAAAFVKSVEKWLGNAHDRTSPFFREFVSADVMNKFN